MGTNKSPEFQALREAFYGAQQEEQIYRIKNKYSSLNALSRSQKIEAVKDTSLNPFLFNDPYDGLTNSLWRWTKEAPAFAGSAQRDKVAGDYYDNVLQPLYAKMKVDPLSKDLWMKEAWNQALKYDPSSSYHSPLIHGLIEGGMGVVEQGARAGATIYNLLGIPIRALGDTVRDGDFSALSGFQNLALNMHNRTGIEKDIEKKGENTPLLGAVSRFERGLADYASFWKDVNPNQTFTEKATSLITEQALMLPLYVAGGAAAESGLGLAMRAAEGVTTASNLTSMLAYSKPGEMALKLLTTGAEGATWGVLTRPVGDKNNAWQDALAFAAMGTSMSFMGSGAKKLFEHLPKSAEKDLADAAEKEAELGAKGVRSTEFEEQEDDQVSERASNMTAGGRPLQQSIDEQALDYVAAWGAGGDVLSGEYKDFFTKGLQRDPAQFKSLMSSIGAIQNYLKENNLDASILRKPEENKEAIDKLTSYLSDLSKRAGEEMELRVDALSEKGASDLLKAHLKTEKGQKEFASTVQNLKDQFAKIGKPIEDEKAQSLAMKQMLEKRKQFIQRAKESLAVEGPSNAAKTIKDVPSTPGTLKTRSEYERDPKGRVTGYSLRVDYNWEVQAQAMAKAKGWTKRERADNEFWENFVSPIGNNDDTEDVQEFVEDLKDYFQPLSAAKLKFEKGNLEDHTNYLGFMYAYKDKLPDPVANKLTEILIGSPKMQNILRTSQVTESQLDHFSAAIHNHVDNFMNSKWYRDKGERNIFRSTQPRMGKKTQWQRDLLDDRIKNEIKTINKTYPGRSRAVREAKDRALQSLKALQSLRDVEWDRANKRAINSAEFKMAAYSKQIKDLERQSKLLMSRLGKGKK